MKNNNNNAQTDNHPIAPDQDWEIDLFRPEDAAGVTRLFRLVYGANYPIRAYIDPELLKNENRDRHIISSVARTANGDIVGHNALFQSAPYKNIYESGAGLVHKDYRGGHGIFTDLIAHGIEVGHRDFGIELIYGESVCNHVFSQKAGYNLKMFTRAIEIDLMPAAAYNKEKSATGRVSTMLCFRTLISKPHTVYLPPLYEKQMNFLYKNLDDSRTIKLADQTLDESCKTKLDIEVFNFANVARIAVLEMGSDLSEILQTHERKLQESNIKVFQIWLNLAAPTVGDATAKLHKSGYFFGGLLPQWFGSDGLLLQKTVDAPHWDNMQIHYDDDLKLLEMVRSDWEQLSQHTG